MNLNSFVLVVLLCAGCWPVSTLFAASPESRPMRACRVKDALVCSHCEERFCSEYLLHEHEQEHEAAWFLEFSAYAKRQARKTRARYRRNTAKVGKSAYEVVCKTCGSEWPSIAQLNVHMRSHNGIKPYQCGYCDKRFTVNTTWKRHERTHTGEKPFVCDFCNDTFTRKDTMEAHRRRHTGEKPYCCEVVGCQAKFRVLSMLKKHMNKHDADEPKVCRRKTSKKSAETAALVEEAAGEDEEATVVQQDMVSDEDDQDGVAQTFLPVDDPVLPAGGGAPFIGREDDLSDVFSADPQPPLFGLAVGHFDPYF